MHPLGIVLTILATIFLLLSVRRLFKEITHLRESAVTGAESVRLVRPSLWDILFVCVAPAALLGADPHFWPSRFAHVPAAVVVFTALALTFAIVPASARVGAAFVMNRILDAKAHS